MSASKPAAYRHKTPISKTCAQSPFQVVDDFRAWARQFGLDWTTTQYYIYEYSGHGFDYLRAGLLCIRQRFEQSRI